MKRFTETTKWADPWYRALSPADKLLWIYMLDVCDHAGILEMDWPLASFVIGEEVTPANLRVFAGRVEKLKDDKLWIVGFVKFQWGPTPPSNRIGQTIARRLGHYKLLERAFQ